MTGNEVLLRVENLKTYFHTYEGVVRALEGIDIEVMKGETLGLVGETGCGKSVTALTIMGLIPKPPGKVESGMVSLGEPDRVSSFRKEYDARFANDAQGRRREIAEIEARIPRLDQKEHADERRELRDRLDSLYRSYDLIRMEEAELNKIRGARMSMIFQEPMTALNPAYTIGNQIGETIELHQLEKLIDDVIAQLDREKAALKKGTRATGRKPSAKERDGDSSMQPEAADILVCSECAARARTDWHSCTTCGSRFRGRFSMLQPGPVRKLRLSIASSYYSRAKENPYNTWAYLVRFTSLTRRLERRPSLAKTMRAEDALKEVKIAEPGRVARSYPFELSGGMKQRAMIAMMMSCQPELLIADEPTTALDVTVEAQILSLMKELQRKRNTSIMLITHDLGIIAETCHRVAIMYAGYIAELATTQDIFSRPLHPYTHALLRSIPKIGPEHMHERKKALYVIPGTVPNLLKPPTGCRFHPRCERALDVCKSVVPPLEEKEPGHFAACHNPVPRLEASA